MEKIINNKYNLNDEELDKIIKDKVKQVKTLDYTTDEIQSFMKKGKRRRYIKNIIKFIWTVYHSRLSKRG